MARTLERTRDELAAFLRSRRERISPDQAGTLTAVQFEIDIPQNMFLPIILIN